MAIFFKKNFGAIFLKSCQVFGNFLIIKWQFSAGTDDDRRVVPQRNHLEISKRWTCYWVNLYLYLLPIITALYWTYRTYRLAWGRGAQCIIILDSHIRAKQCKQNPHNCTHTMLQTDQWNILRIQSQKHKL